MSDVAERLDAAVPAYEGTGNWSTVLRDAGVRTSTRRRPLRLAVALAVAALAAVAAVAWPFEGSSPSVIDRALAAAGTGSVLHVVFESPEPSKTLVDLKTGERTVVDGRQEIWFDPTAGMRTRETFQGVVQYDVSQGAADVPQHAREVYGSLGESYRDALASGDAEVVGHGEVDGVPVYWIRIAPAHEVAVSHETYLPVEVRIEGGGGQGVTRVLSYETLSAGNASFDTPDVGILEGLPQPGRELTLDEATAILGRPAVTAGGSAPTSVRRLGDGVQLAYGSTTSMDYVELTEAAGPADSVTTLAGVRNYAPPEGTLLLAGSSGLLRSNGLVIAIHTGDPEKTLALARALRSGDG